MKNSIAYQSSIILVVVHIAYMTIEAVFTLYLVGTHGTRKLRLHATLVTLVLYKSTPTGIAPATSGTNVRFVLNQSCHTGRSRRPPTVS
jgi:hypothetical protein